MAAPPILTLSDAAVSFGPAPVFAHADVIVNKGDRISLVGRNGTGKSTLLRVLAGAVQLDRGQRFAQPATKLAYLAQDPSLPAGVSVADYVAQAETAPEPHRVDFVLDRLGVDPAADCGRLSGGERRRAALGRVFVEAADVLLLDEPTNHLDIAMIEWLESELGRFAGTLVIVSHDRAFLSNLTRVTLWLDRGTVHRLEMPFSQFEEWLEETRRLEDERRARLDARIAREERWMERGVTARRKRNQGRLQRLRKLREDRRQWLSEPGRAKLSLARGEAGGDLVIEAEGIGMSVESPEGTKTLFRDFSTRITRRDRIGIVGPNGSGKTTLLKVLTGEILPDSGAVRLGARVEPIVFDQQRASLDPERTLWETLIPDGGDSLIVQGRQRHVVGYLRDFLFAEEQARQPVKTLSGGEKSRLVLARLFARPGNLVVLDEPTNDLDLETLDLLVDVLSAFEGTLILVSHDRDFMDRLVTGIVAFEGRGRLVEYAGGYSDYAGLRPRAEDERRPERQRSRSSAPKPEPARTKLSYKLQRELDELPERMRRLNVRKEELAARLEDPDLYTRDPERFHHFTRDLEETEKALEAAEERWLELEELREQLAAGDARR